MSNPNTPSSTGSYAGDNGANIYNRTHNDIDTSNIDVSCVTGKIEVILHERIWSTWVRRESWRLNAGQTMNEVVNVDSAWYDGDHMLRIYARVNGSSCNLTFTSTDE